VHIYIYISVCIHVCVCAFMYRGQTLDGVRHSLQRYICTCQYVNHDDILTLTYMYTMMCIHVCVCLFMYRPFTLDGVRDPLQSQSWRHAVSGRVNVSKLQIML